MLKIQKWTVDQSDGTMYFFLDENNGWRLVITDAAAGSRFYVMEKTMDGGSTWECIMMIRSVDNWELQKV